MKILQERDCRSDDGRCKCFRYESSVLEQKKESRPAGDDVSITAPNEAS
jgi:hypothetical protein